MRRRHTVPAQLAAGAACGALLLAGCSASDDGGGGGEFDPDEEITLEISWWGDDDRAALFDEVIGNFMAEYPNITVEQTPVGSPDDLFNRLATDFGGGGTTARPGGLGGAPGPGHGPTPRARPRGCCCSPPWPPRLDSRGSLRARTYCRISCRCPRPPVWWLSVGPSPHSGEPPLSSAGTRTPWGPLLRWCLRGDLGPEGMGCWCAAQGLSPRPELPWRAGGACRLL